MYLTVSVGLSLMNEDHNLPQNILQVLGFGCGNIGGENSDVSSDVCLGHQILEEPSTALTEAAAVAMLRNTITKPSLSVGFRDMRL